MDGLGGPLRRFIGLAMIILPCLSLPHRQTAERNCRCDREEGWDGWRERKTDGRQKERRRGQGRLERCAGDGVSLKMEEEGDGGEGGREGLMKIGGMMRRGSQEMDEAKLLG